MDIKITEKVSYDNQIYHYCSLETFRLIIENRTLFMSDFHYMNDSSEESYFLNIFSEEMKKIYDNFSQEEKEKLKNKKSKYMYKYMTNLEKIYPNVCFICCFSKKHDDLNQWRAYGDDGKGVCIGFDKSFFEKLKINSRFFAQDVKYLCKKELSDFISKELEEIKNTYNPNDYRSDAKFTQEVYKKIGKKRALIKNISFQAEEEFRIGFYDKLSDDAITQYVYDDGNHHIGAEGIKQNMNKKYQSQDKIVELSAVDYRTSKNLLISYRKLDLGEEFFNAIKSVTIGPKCSVSKTEIAKFIVCKCTDKYFGYDQVSKSNIPYI